MLTVLWAVTLAGGAVSAVPGEPVIDDDVDQPVAGVDVLGLRAAGPIRGAVPLVGGEVGPLAGAEGIGTGSVVAVLVLGAPVLVEAPSGFCTMPEPGSRAAGGPFGTEPVVVVDTGDDGGAPAATCDAGDRDGPDTAGEDGEPADVPWPTGLFAKGEVDAADGKPDGAAAADGEPGEEDADEEDGEPRGGGFPAEGLDEEPEGEPGVVPDGSAHEIPAVLAPQAPTPNATANAPTRPIYRALLIAVPSVCPHGL